MNREVVFPGEWWYMAKSRKHKHCCRELCSALHWILRSTESEWDDKASWVYANKVFEDWIDFVDSKDCNFGTSLRLSLEENGELY